MRLANGAPLPESACLINVCLSWSRQQAFRVDMLYGSLVREVNCLLGPYSSNPANVGSRSNGRRPTIASVHRSRRRAERAPLVCGSAVTLQIPSSRPERTLDEYTPGGREGNQISSRLRSRRVVNGVETGLEQLPHLARAWVESGLNHSRNPEDL